MTADDDACWAAAPDFVWGVAGAIRSTMTFERPDRHLGPRRAFSAPRIFWSLHPGLRPAGPTWGWVAAAYRSIARFLAPGYAEKISTPALIMRRGA